MAETRSTCPYCGVGCGVIIQAEAGRITGVRGDPEHPANFGRLCSKGATLHLTAAAELQTHTRLLQPLRRLQRGGPAQPLAWDAALDHGAERLAQIHAAHGPDAIGVYVSGQLLTEDYHVFNKLVRGVLASHQIDSNSRLCMSSAVAGYKASLGADAPPCSYEDLALADCVFISGSNTALAHPVLMRRLEDARRARPGQRWIVVDPRRTETAAMADLHLALRPGSDVALCHGLLHLMLWEGWLDTRFIAEHTEGFEALKARVREFNPAHTARLTGITEADLLTAARWFATSGATLSLYCQGLNQSSAGTDKNRALINLHLATGQIARPGAGPFSLTGQPNAMGGREAGGMATLLPGHRDPSNAAHRAEIAALWGLPALSERPGRSAVEMFQAAADGEVKALWIACTNPAQSLPDQAMVRRALQRAEFVILQEAFAGTATAAYADLLLPAATWGEKEGTVTNSERRISRVRAAVAPAGQARADWAIAADLGRRLARRIAPERERLLCFASPEDVWGEHREATRGRDLDITGLSYALLDSAGPQQWPMPQGQAQGTARLYADGRFATPDGRARFADVEARPLAEPRSARYPFTLSTGRLRDQWHGMSRTGLLGRLFGDVPLPQLALHPQDLAQRRLREGQWVRVQSARGELRLPVRAVPELAPGLADLPMHWGSEVLGGRDAQGQPLAGVNGLTLPALCPQSRQPELKAAAVSVEPLAVGWELRAWGWFTQAEAWALRERLQPLLRGLDAALLLPFGREPDTQQELGWMLWAAHAEAPPRELLADALAAFGADDAATLRYDAGPGRSLRLLRVEAGAAEARLRSAWLSGPPAELQPAADTLQAWVRERMPLPCAARQLLRPGVDPAQLGAAPPRGPQLCSCMDVSEASAVAALAAADGPPETRVAVAQAATRCGTCCGSCLPRLRRLAVLQAQTLSTT